MERVSITCHASEPIWTTAQINAPNTARDEAVAALIALGFSRTEAMTSVVGIEGDGLTSEDYIKNALRQRR